MILFYWSYAVTKVCAGWLLGRLASRFVGDVGIQVPVVPCAAPSAVSMPCIVLVVYVLSIVSNRSIEYRCASFCPCLANLNFKVLCSDGRASSSLCIRWPMPVSSFNLGTMGMLVQTPMIARHLPLSTYPASIRSITGSASVCIRRCPSQP